jgi:hypothetical protein
MVTISLSSHDAVQHSSLACLGGYFEHCDGFLICPESGQEHDSFQTVQAMQTALTVDGRDYTLTTSRNNL